MERLLAAFGDQRLSRLTDGRRLEQRRVIEEFLRSIHGGSPGGELADALQEFLQARADAGYGPGTRRKWRTMILAFYGWCHDAGAVSADTLLRMRAVPVPDGSTGRGRPNPYRLSEVRALTTEVAARWPKLDHEEWAYWLGRWRENRSPYARVRVHGIRLQLDAIITLALCCGLRRREIWALDEPWIHYDNFGVVVWDDAGPWKGNAREVPYTDATRGVIHEWVEYRAALRPEHQRAWLNLWSERTMRDPMSRHTFDRLLSTYVGPSWTYRRLRDTCATSWSNAGLALEHLRQLLGLASLGDVFPYAALARGRLERKMEDVEPAFLRAVGLPARALVTT